MPASTGRTSTLPRMVPTSSARSTACGEPWGARTTLISFLAKGWEKIAGRGCAGGDLGFPGSAAAVSGRDRPERRQSSGHGKDGGDAEGHAADSVGEVMPADLHHAESDRRHENDRGKDGGQG